MIDKKLIREVGSSLYHIKRNVGYQWLMLVLNILLITVLTWLLAALLSGAQLVVRSDRHRHRDRSPRHRPAPLPGRPGSDQQRAGQPRRQAAAA